MQSSSPTLMTIIRMVESLPEATQKQVVEHLHEYLAELTTNQGIQQAIVEELHCYTDQELLNMSSVERGRILSKVFVLAADEDFEIFEANNKDDFIDEADWDHLFTQETR